MTASPTAPPVRVVRVLHAPIGDVFAALTDPAVMAQWFSPEGHARVRADVREGGRLSVVMVGRDVEIEHTGTYLEVRAPHRLVFTWRSRFTGERESRVEIELEPEGRETTRLTLTHGLLTAEEAASHAGGWAGILARLEAVVTDRRTGSGGG